jgi:hypothetical protein
MSRRRRSVSLQLSRSSTHDRRMHASRPLSKGSQMADWSTRHERLCRGDDSVGTDAIVPVKIDKRAGSSEMPRNLVRCPARHPARQKPLDVRAGMDEATFARTGVKPIG